MSGHNSYSQMLLFRYCDWIMFTLSSHILSLPYSSWDERVYWPACQVFYFILKAKNQRNEKMKKQINMEGILWTAYSKWYTRKCSYHDIRERNEKRKHKQTIRQNKISWEHIHLVHRFVLIFFPRMAKIEHRKIDDNRRKWRPRANSNI